MKIVFIVPAAKLMRSFVYRWGAKIYGQKNNITGPLILGTILKKAGHEVEVYEELYQDVDYQSLEADIYGIYTMSSNSIRGYEIADFLKKEIGKRVIIGGMHASARPEEAACHADQVVVGEAESVIKDVVEGKINEKIIQAKPLQNLDSIPFPDYSLLKTPTDAANVLTTRGCPNQCSFCTTSRMFAPYRRRSIDSVIEELRSYKNAGFEYINFQDDNFTADSNRVKALLKRMINENLVFKETFFFGRKDFLEDEDEELLELMERSNLNRVLIGFESFKQESLDKINKKQKVADVNKLKEHAEKLSEHKIKILASLVLGVDTDSKEDIRKSVQVCKDINAYQLQPAILTPFPGTLDYKNFEQEGRIITKQWNLYDMIHAVFKPANMSPAELEEEAFRAFKNFYDFKGALKMRKLFGKKEGLMRLVFALAGIIPMPLYKYFHKKTS